MRWEDFILKVLYYAHWFQKTWHFWKIHFVFKCCDFYSKSSPLINWVESLLDVFVIWEMKFFFKLNKYCKTIILLLCALYAWSYSLSAVIKIRCRVCVGMLVVCIILWMSYSLFFHIIWHYCQWNYILLYYAIHWNRITGQVLRTFAQFHLCFTVWNKKVTLWTDRHLLSIFKFSFIIF